MIYFEWTLKDKPSNQYKLFCILVILLLEWSSNLMGWYQRNYKPKRSVQLNNLKCYSSRNELPSDRFQREELHGFPPSVEIESKTSFVLLVIAEIEHNLNLVQKRLRRNGDVRRQSFSGGMRFFASHYFGNMYCAQ